MSRLDDPALIETLDPAAMGSQIEAFGDRITAGLALAPTPTLRLDSPPRRVVVCGMGGSAVAGDIVRVLADGRLEVPFEVSRNYSLPAGCDRETLAFFCSYSGNTEETLSAWDEGRSAGVAAVAITSGGRLAKQARQDELPLISLPGGHPPRASFGYALGAMLEVLAGAGVLESRRLLLDEALRRLQDRHREWGSASPDGGNEAKQLAQRLCGSIPVFYGSAGRLVLVAARWAAQVAENGKQLAYASELPEMNHNEIVGWRHPARALGGLCPVFLLDRDDHPANRRRAAITADLMREAGVESLQVETRGDSWEERALALILLGDYVSWYLALLNGEDPTPVAAIDRLKNRLAENPEAEGGNES